MSAQFWFIAGLFTGVAATAVAIALWRGAVGGAHLRPTRPVVLTVLGIAVFALVAVGLHGLLGSAHPLESPPLVTSPAQPNASLPAAGSNALSMEAATAQLEARLSREGGSESDWELLAQSYAFLGRTADAERARAHKLDSAPSGAPAALPLAEVAKLIENSPKAPETRPADSPVAQDPSGQAADGKR